MVDLTPFQDRPRFPHKAWALTPLGEVCQVTDFVREECDGLRVVEVMYRDNLETHLNGLRFNFAECLLLPIDHGGEDWRARAQQRALGAGIGSAVPAPSRARL